MHRSSDGRRGRTATRPRRGRRESAAGARGVSSGCRDARPRAGCARPSHRWLAYSRQLRGSNGGGYRSGYRAATDGKRAEISVFRGVLHYRLQTAQSLAGREFRAVRRCSERYTPDAAKSQQMATFE
ncbi:hypothetical protein BLAT2472_60348 [Burkholderia latens]